MKVLLYLFVILYCISGQTSDAVANNQNGLILKYQELRKSAVDGDINSQYEIFNFVNSNNDPKLNEHLTEAFKFMIKAGDAGHTEAQFTIGSMYQAGNLLEKNSDVALGWLLGAAKNDHRKAQLLVGNNYSIRAIDATEAKVKNENNELAIYWYEKSIIDSSIMALKQYGIFLFMIDTFSAKADKLLSQVAESGDSEAMYWLGKMYAHRWNDNKGDVEFELAHSWLEKAKLNGYKSQEFIDGLNERKKNYLERIAKENKEEQ
ncbi:tetratricopeptide repeat protein [Colwellia sp. BRX9-1]|uniref:tetratricopeptide repeat protein n=1 Tax=Colwellia sp. BRX9-1 TaxID=2759830 RepID=UPI0015F7225D|nr:tetratricopeptide repeat protein [Colwellia sp. BRX9-1]MBA6352953.1 sel1 repeat family protein [Colwellia sp. BRX9-1]